MILFVFPLASYYIKLQSMVSYNTKGAVKHQYLCYLYLLSVCLSIYKGEKSYCNTILKL